MPLHVGTYGTRKKGIGTEKKKCERLVPALYTLPSSDICPPSERESCDFLLNGLELAPEYIFGATSKALTQVPFNLYNIYYSERNLINRKCV